MIKGVKTTLNFFSSPHIHCKEGVSPARGDGGVGSTLAVSTGETPLGGRGNRAYASLVNIQNNCNRFRVRGEVWFFYHPRKGYAPFNCKTWSCPICGPKRAKRLKQAITEWAYKKGLSRFLVLTLDPKFLEHVPHKERYSYFYMMHVWRKFRVYLYRKYGKISYVWTIEPQKSGICHLNVLINRYIDQSWISEVFSKLGGGKIVWIERADIRRVGAYISKYITKMYEWPIPRRKRRFGCSRDIKLFGLKNKVSEWVVVRFDILTYKVLCVKVVSGLRAYYIHPKNGPPCKLG
jgi:hypothetical protein